MKLKERARLKLAKMLNIKFEAVETDTTKLLYDGELEIGSEVFIEDAEGNLAIPEDGEYVVDEKTVLVVEGGIVIDIKVSDEEVEEPTQIEEEFEDESKTALEERVEALEGQVATLVEIIKEITGVVDEVQEDVEEVAEEIDSIDEEFKKATGKTIKNPIQKKTIKQSKSTSLTERFFG